MVKPLERAVVLGGLGGFGQVFTHRLTQAGVQVVSVDKHERADVYCDVQQDIAPLIPLLDSAQLLLLCVPEPIAVQTLEKLHAHPVEGLCIADICSVKTKVVATAQQCCVDSEYVSIHPMFGPDRAFDQHGLVVIDVREGGLAEGFKQVLVESGARIVKTDAATHDRVTSVVQVLTHAALLTFAQARAQLDAPADLIEAMGTPIYKELVRVAQGMLKENAELYHNIQTANPWGSEAREALSRAVAGVTGSIDADAPERMVQMFERLRDSS